MKVGAFFGSYLKAADCQKPILLTVRNVVEETVGQGEDASRKPVAYFEECEKGLALNKTNADAMTEIAGDDETNLWSGMQVVLYKSQTKLRGSTVDCVRVRAPMNQPAQAQQRPAPRTIEEPVPEADIPF